MRVNVTLNAVAGVKLATKCRMHFKGNDVLLFMTMLGVRELGWHLDLLMNMFVLVMFD